MMVGEVLLVLHGVLLFLSSTVNGDAMVTGIVFCDQCLEGRHSILDYPLYGAKVAVSCGGGAEGPALYKEDDTNWFGSYVVRFEGSPDLSGCQVRVVGGPPRCGAAAGPAQPVRLMFRMFGMAMYAADPLLSQPFQPVSFCPRSSAPQPGPIHQAPPVTRPPVLPRAPPAPPRLPFFEPSACSYEKWMMPDYKCYWKVVGPETKVALAFGPVAAGRYGADMTLWDGLNGRGDLYRTLLREGTTSLLNSYNSVGFFYPALSVIERMNWALLGSPRDALMAAMRFRRANLGVANGLANRVGCNFSHCS